MGNQLEQQLGELNGVLKGLVPALERLENRQNETEREASAVGERLEGLRRIVDETKVHSGDRFKDLYEKCNQSMKDHKDNETKLKIIEIDVKDLKNKSEGLGQKVWEIFKILFATAVTAFVTWRLTKGG